MDNLNYYSAWLPAGQLTDRYSSQPWCLRSKNLDIFSSSKSVKATAWSEPTTTDTDIVKQDWKLILKTDWKVYERENGVDTLINDPWQDFPIYQVSYNWENGDYEEAQWGTVQDMAVVYEWEEWRGYTIFTDRAQLVYSKLAKTFNKELRGGDFSVGETPTEYGYELTANALSGTYVVLRIKNTVFGTMPMRLYCVEPDTTDVTINLNNIKVDFFKDKYYFDAQMDAMVWTGSAGVNIPFEWTLQEWITVNIPIAPNIDGYDYCRVIIDIDTTRREWKTGNSWVWWKLYVDINGWPDENHRMTIDGETLDWDYNAQYSYLPIRERKLVSIWDYAYSQSYWMKGVSFQPIYKWVGAWVETNEWKAVMYDFISDMWWESDPRMDVIWMMIWNEQAYMIWNLDWNGYIIPCDLSWSRWTPFIAYWCTFKGVTNIDYLMYLVWEDRWVSLLWVFNNQEIVPVIWWKHEVQYNDVIGVDEQYKFDWKILNWRKNLILTTIDNRIFQYGQTYGGKGGTFIHELPQNATITWLRTSWNNLEVAYSITEGQTTTNYVITYQDDTPMKNYNIEWEATYPIVIGNHLLEKEESDLYVSYILPSEDTSLEFWGMANHYHFWTFKTNWQTIPEAWTKWYIDWSDWMYMLDFVEANGEYLTFKLEWDLPLMTWDETMRIRDYLVPVWQPYTYIAYSEFNHFRKIWEITTENYQEWEFRFHNLNNKLELPKSYSLQIMVKGKWNNDYTPELFALDLVANQRDRW